MAARAGEAMQKLADRRLLTVDDIEDDMEAAADTDFAFDPDQLTRKRAVEIMAGKIDPEKAAELVQ